MKRKKTWPSLLITFSLANFAVAENLPFDRTNPFIWDNDTEHDARALTLCLALDKLGEINLIGISQAPHPYPQWTSDLQEIVNKREPRDGRDYRMLPPD